jgi:hypothetical protein
MLPPRLRVSVSVIDQVTGQKVGAEAHAHDPEVLPWVIERLSRDLIAYCDRNLECAMRPDPERFESQLKELLYG